MNEQSTATIIDRLKSYNEWRRGNDCPQPDPKAVGEDIDRICEIAERLERQRDEAREPLDFFDATNAFIDAALQRYAYRNDKDADLTQVFMRGPFAGWSERQVVELIRQLDENRNLHRLEP